MKKSILFILAVLVVYAGGFAYEEIGPVLYGVVVALIASTPLLLKVTFWKKILLMIPLLVLRVVGKILIQLFGKSALSRLMAKYGLLEQRFNKTLATLLDTKDTALARWQGMSHASQAYLIIIFLPVAILLVLFSLVVKMVRLKFLQFIIEKVIQKYMVKASAKVNVRRQNLPTADAEPADRRLERGQVDGKQESVR